MSVDAILLEIETLTGHPAEVVSPGSVDPFEVRVRYAPKKWVWAQGKTPLEAAKSALKHAKGGQW